MKFDVDLKNKQKNQQNDMKSKFRHIAVFQLARIIQQSFMPRLLRNHALEGQATVGIGYTRKTTHKQK